TVLLLDEPFTGLDDESVTGLLERLHALTARGVLVVLATHDLDVVSGHLDEAYLLHDGRLVVLSRAMPLREAYRQALARDANAPEPAPAEPGFAAGGDRHEAHGAPARDDAGPRGDDVAAIARTALAVLEKDLRIE